MTEETCTAIVTWDTALCWQLTPALRKRFRRLRKAGFRVVYITPLNGSQDSCMTLMDEDGHRYQLDIIIDSEDGQMRRSESYMAIMGAIDAFLLYRHIYGLFVVLRFIAISVAAGILGGLLLSWGGSR